MDEGHQPSRPALQILTIEETLLWQVPLEGDVPEAYPRPWMKVLGWSPDGGLLYFCDEWSPDGGNYAFWWTGYRVRSIDVGTGKVATVIDGEGQVSLAFSPDGMLLAYVRQEDQPKTLHIRDLATSKERLTQVINPTTDYALVGDFHWAEDGSMLAYQTQDKDYRVQTVVLDKDSLRQRVVREYKPFEAWFQGWLGDDYLEYRQEDEGVVARLDLRTGRIQVLGTSTPSPRP